MPVIVKDLSYVYSPKTPFESRALDHINLEIQDGEFVGIIGHTGSGKSTLVQLICGLIRPTEGTVIIDGMDIFAKDADKKKLRSTVGMVFQYPEYQLFEETVEKDIAFGPTKAGISGYELAERVKEAMELVGMDYEKYKDRSPFELSGGQKRKAAIAGVLAMRPRVLIMDEPIAGLDPIGRDNLMDLVKALNDRGTTILMISHNMDGMAEYVSKIVAMRDGKVVAQGRPEEIFSKHELLEEEGLGLPEAAYAVKLLRAQGKEIPKEIIRYGELRDYLIRKLGGKADD